MISRWGVKRQVGGPEAKRNRNGRRGRAIAGTAFFLLAALVLVHCGSAGYSNSGNPGNSGLSMTVKPGSATVAEGGQQQFSATVRGSSNAAVTWYATGGTITSGGLYTPGNAAGNFSVSATSMADSSKSGQAAVTVTANAPPPLPPGTASTITKDGITWTFSQAVPVGQFVNGDYYVVRPVTITAIDPALTTSSPYLNGSVKNLPTANQKCGFDSRLNDGTDESWWSDATLRSYPPITLQPRDALVSSISLATIHSDVEVMRASDMSASPVKTVSVLTVVAAAPTADAFRPSYCDRGQTIYHANSVQRNLLPSLAQPNPGNTPPISQFETWYRGPWIDTNPFLFDAPADYMPSYGQHVAFVDSYAALLLELDFPADQKVNLTNYFVQYGIDL
jgi:hypothetical protein